MWKSKLTQWQQTLVIRLERALGRDLVADDMEGIVWNQANEALTVQTSLLLGELRSRNLISNVFRSQRIWRKATAPS